MLFGIQVNSIGAAAGDRGGGVEEMAAQVRAHGGIRIG
jgi:hypothetical protein